MHYLYIAEKPSTMNAVKAFYEKSNKWLGEIDFCCFSGHVCRYLEPIEYPEWKGKSWKDIDLPIIPEPFQITVSNVRSFNKVKGLLDGCNYDAIIVGTDSDQEGNGIYDLFAKYFHLEPMKTLRFFERDMTDAGIKNSLEHLTDYHKNPRDVGMSEAYYIRSVFDWLVGFNLTIGYTVKTGILLKIGRVKAPTLKLVYDNSKAIGNFTEHTSYQPCIQNKDNNLTAYLIKEDGSDSSYDTKADAEKVVDRCQPEVHMESVTKKTVRKYAAPLFKLTDVQVAAGKKYGYPPDLVLSILQSLYEKHKVLSYPRTDGRHLSTDKAKEFPKLLKAAMVFPELKEVIRNFRQEDIDSIRGNKKYVDNDMVAKSSHDALIPTGKIPNLKELDEKERNILNMIYKRFVSIFMGPLVEEKTQVICRSDEDLYCGKGSKVISPGFTVIYENSPKETIIGDLKKGENITVDWKDVHDIKSAPPKRFTQATLIDAMENLHKYINNENNLKKVLKDAKGIGQPATRAAIISDLLKTGYIAEKKNGLYITNKGKFYIETLKDSSIINPELSASWEQHLVLIRQREEDYRKVYETILGYIDNSLSELNEMTFEHVNLNGDEVDVKCPKCGKNMQKLNWGYGCSGYPDCRFSVGKIGGKTLTEKQLKQLLEKGETSLIKGFHKKAKKDETYSAILTYDGDKIGFKFPNSK